jgi:hypothetical protein
VQKKAIAAKQILHGLRLVFIPDSSEKCLFAGPRGGRWLTGALCNTVFRKAVRKSKEKNAKHLLFNGKF